MKKTAPFIKKCLCRDLEQAGASVLTQGMTENRIRESRKD